MREKPYDHLNISGEGIEEIQFPFMINKTRSQIGGNFFQPDIGMKLQQTLYLVWYKTVLSL